MPPLLCLLPVPNLPFYSYFCLKSSPSLYTPTLCSPSLYTPYLYTPFTDFITKDEVTGECFRADKLLEDGIDAMIAGNPNMTIQEKEELQLVQVYI